VVAVGYKSHIEMILNLQLVSTPTSLENSCVAREVRLSSILITDTITMVYITILIAAAAAVAPAFAAPYGASLEARGVVSKPSVHKPVRIF